MPRCSLVCSGRGWHARAHDHALHTLRVFLGPDGAGGNPLGVVARRRRACRRRERQAVAADLGFSETVFVDDRATGALRIFTPAVELPLAGHPLVGTSWLLAHTGAPVDTLRPPAGDVPTWADGELTWIRARPEWATLYDVAQLPSPADVDAFAVPGGDAMVAVWAWEDEAAGACARACSRTASGSTEDEATGAAALQLGSLIGRDIVIRQGAGSELHARPRRDGGRRRRRPRRARVRAGVRRGPTAERLTSSARRESAGIDTAAILCGGRGTRLHGDIPKPLVEVGGLPIVWHVVVDLRRAGRRAGRCC